MCNIHFEAIIKNLSAVIDVLYKHNAAPQEFEHSSRLSRERNKMYRPDSDNLMNQRVNQSKAAEEMSLTC